MDQYIQIANLVITCGVLVVGIVMYLNKGNAKQDILIKEISTEQKQVISDLKFIRENHLTHIEGDMRCLRDGFIELKTKLQDHLEDSKK